MKQKLCYILPFFDTNIDTHHFYLYDFVRELSRTFDITLIIEKGSSDTSYFEGVSQVYVQRYTHGPLRILENLWLVLRARMRGCRAYYIHYSQIGAINASLVARLSGARTYYWNCGMMWLFGKKPLLKVVLHMVHYLVTGVETLAKGYSETYGISRNKIKIMPNWIDLKRFDALDESVYERYGLDRSVRYVTFVHRLAKRKGAQYIGEIARAFADIPDVQFLIAGDGPYRVQLEVDIQDLSNVQLLGKVPNKDIPSLLMASHVFFMPSEEEGFPRVLAEAMAAGTPFVAFDIGGVREISHKENAPYIVTSKDDMVQGIQKLLTDVETYQSLQKTNLTYVERYDKIVVEQQFISLFDE